MRGRVQKRKKGEDGLEDGFLSRCSAHAQTLAYEGLSREEGEKSALQIKHLRIKLRF